MTDAVESKPQDSAEQAFAEASAALGAATPVPAATVVPAVKPIPEAVQTPAPAAAAVPVAAPAPVAAAKPAPVIAQAPVTASVVAPVVAKASPATPAAPAKPRKAATAKLTAKRVKKPAAISKPVTQKKEIPMATKKTPDFTEGLKDFAADAQKQAKTVYAKGSALLAEAGAFTKGNVEALVELGKIVAAGAQTLGKAYVAETKTAVEVAKADVKAFAAVRSPIDFFKLQGAILSRNTKTAFALGTKNSENLAKLAGDAFAPISGRVSLAIEKIKQAA